SLDPDLYQGLIFLVHFPETQKISRSFYHTVTDEGIVQTVGLKPNGSSIPVTRDNKLEHTLRISHYRKTFNEQELQVFFFFFLNPFFVNTPIDIDDLRRNTNFVDVYSADEPTNRAFWKVYSYERQESCAQPLLCG
ncbi:hypothetical protein BJY52DRAFT_1123519, partial [Lactarius psammicola]